MAACLQNFISTKTNAETDKNEQAKMDKLS